MGMWGDRVVPRLTDRALRGARGRRAARAACAGLQRTGARDRLRQRAQRALATRPAVTSVSARSSRRTSPGGSPRGRRARQRRPGRAAPGLDGQRLAAAGRLARQRAGDVHACARSPTPLLALRGGAAGACAPAGGCTSSSTGWPPRSPSPAGSVGWSPCSARVFARLPPDPRRAGPARVRRVAGRRTGSSAYLPGPALARPWTLRLPARGRLRRRGRMVSVRGGGTRRGTAR